MTWRDKQHKMVLLSRSLKGELDDVSDLTAGQERALRFALDLVERHVVGDDFDEARANADMQKAAAVLEWFVTDVPGDCPLLNR